MISAVNVFETTCSRDKGGTEVDLTKRVLSHARGNTTRDICEDKGLNNSCEDETSQVIPMEGSHTLKDILSLTAYEVMFMR